MNGFLKALWKEKLYAGFLMAGFLIFLVGLVGIVSVLRISRSFQVIERDIVREVIGLGEIRSALSLMLLEMTSFLIIDFSSEEAVQSQISHVMEYEQKFEDGLTLYNAKTKSRQLDFNKDEVLYLVKTIIAKKQEGASMEEILIYKKQLKVLEEEDLFPKIQENIDVASERLDVERVRNRSTVLAAIIFIVLSGALGSVVIIFLGFRISKKEKLVDQFREQLISIASHQLKTPITIIGGNAELLSENAKLSEEDKENVQTIRDTTANMGLLIEDLLDFSRIDQGKFVITKKPVDISILIQEIVDIFQPLAEEKGVKVSFKNPDEKFIVLTDELKMQQAFKNLIDNSIKYSDEENSTVSIVVAKRDSSVFISIQDSGIGIPKEDVGKIFKRFYRASNVTKQRGFGTGLGLFITREIIHQSDGDISFESKEGEGTTFHITLPLRRRGPSS